MTWAYCIHFLKGRCFFKLLKSISQLVHSIWNHPISKNLPAWPSLISFKLIGCIDSSIKVNNTKFYKNTVNRLINVSHDQGGPYHTNIAAFVLIIFHDITKWKLKGLKCWNYQYLLCFSHSFQFCSWNFYIIHSSYKISRKISRKVIQIFFGILKIT